MTHTPGPWECSPTSHYAHDYRLGIPGRQMPFERGGTQQYANARLIAAAPELLDLCYRSLQALEEDLFPLLRENLRIAIAKATDEKYEPTN